MNCLTKHIYFLIQCNVIVIDFGAVVAEIILHVNLIVFDNTDYLNDYL